MKFKIACLKTVIPKDLELKNSINEVQRLLYTIYGTLSLDILLIRLRASSIASFTLPQLYYIKKTFPPLFKRQIARVYIFNVSSLSTVHSQEKLNSQFVIPI